MAINHVQYVIKDFLIANIVQHQTVILSVILVKMVTTLIHQAVLVKHVNQNMEHIVQLAINQNVKVVQIQEFLQEVNHQTPHVKHVKKSSVQIAKHAKKQNA